MQTGFIERDESLIAEYKRRRAEKTLFDVRAIQLAMSDIPLVVKKTVPRHMRLHRQMCRWTTSDLKHELEYYRTNCATKPYENGYITTGDFTMALMLLGFKVMHERLIGFVRCSLMSTSLGVRIMKPRTKSA